MYKKRTLELFESFKDERATLETCEDILFALRGRKLPLDQVVGFILLLIAGARNPGEISDQINKKIRLLEESPEL